MQGSKLTTYLSVVMITAGFVLMFLAWNGASRIASSPDQFPYVLSGTAPGLGLVICGLALAVIQELRRNTARILEALDGGSEEGSVAEGMAGLAVVPDDGSHVVATAKTYHRPDCRIVEGRHDLLAMAHDEAEVRDLEACRVCNPGDVHVA